MNDFKYINFIKQLSQITEMLATHLLTHTFQHTLFDLLKFTLDPPNLYGTHMIW